MFDPKVINQAAFRYYRRLQRIKDFVRAHPAVPPSMTEAASLACLSPSYFSHFFKAKTGVTYMTWLNYERVRRARVLLERHNLGVAEAADAVGFSDASHFSRTFKKFHGLSPSDAKRGLSARTHLDVQATREGRTRHWRIRAEQRQVWAWYPQQASFSAAIPADILLWKIRSDGSD